MKKIIISLNLILFFAVSVFGQVLKPVKIDSLVTVSLPANFTKKDTLGQQIYSGVAALGYMVVIRSENAPGNTSLKKETDLNKVMKAYIDGVKKQSQNGSILNARDTVIGALKAKLFTLRIDNSGAGEAAVLRNFILLYTQEVTYTFEYYYPEINEVAANSGLREFSSSIKVAPVLNRHDQYISNAKGISGAAKAGIYGGGTVVIIFFILVMLRNKKRKRLQSS